jgi:IS30 family transposase
MSNLTTTKNKHLTLDDRIEIQGCLDKGMTFKATGKRVGKDQTTISKEVRKHLQYTPTKSVHKDRNGNVLPTPTCPTLLKTPFVCNPCSKKSYNCPYNKQKYVAKLAQQEYESLLVEAREGLPMCKEAFYEADRIITDGIQDGQHLYHVLQSNDIEMSKSAVYRNLHKGYLSVSAIEFPRVVKFKPRRNKPAEYIPRGVKAGRSYADFSAYIDENAISSWVEMDTVIGRIGGKTIMTLHFTLCNFMAGVLLDNKSSAEVSSKFIALKKSFSHANVRFGHIFPLILTDNGGEFSDVFTIEGDLHGSRGSKLFFCDPYQSSQKPRVEKNHTLFRDIVPKGQSFDTFTQDTVNLIFSHVNSVKRKSLNGKTPYEFFAFSYGEEIANLLGIKSIPENKVIQSPKLLKGKS